MSRDAKIVPITVETLISPSVSVTGSIRTRKRDGRVTPVEGDPQAAVEAAQPRQREQELDERRDDDRAGVDVELGVVAVEQTERSSTRPTMITRFHATGVSAGTANWS